MTAAYGTGENTVPRQYGRIENMGHYIENDCVGCERCISCGRQYDRKTFFCDDCGAYTDELYQYGSEELCWDCYKAEFPQKICDDMDETLCSNCSHEAETMFQYNGEWVCEECLRNMTERVDTEED